MQRINEGLIGNIARSIVDLRGRINLQDSISGLAKSLWIDVGDGNPRTSRTGEASGYSSSDAYIESVREVEDVKEPSKALTCSSCARDYSYTREQLHK